MSGQRGSATLEFTMLVPGLVLTLALILALGLLSEARSDVDDLAWEAARAASLTRSAPEAHAAAHGVVATSQGRERRACPDPEMTVDLTRFQPGGAVAVVVTCAVRLSRLGVPFPADARVRSRAVAPLEPYRALR